MYSYNPYYYEYLAHHGVKGQKWGVRRYQPYTSANKGVFKNLKRSYKSSVRQIKKARKQYDKEGDKLAVDAANKAIKDTKKAYKTELKGLKKEFKAENRAQYIQDVSERGSEKQVAQVRKEMSPDQLNYAVRRINAYKDWEKLSMRDVEKEVKQEQAMERLRRISQGADTVGKVALATTNVISAAKGFKELFKRPSSYEKEKQRLELEGIANKNDLTKAQAEKMRNEIKNNSKIETKPKASEPILPKSTSTSTKVEIKSEPKSSILIDKGSSKSSSKGLGIFGENLKKSLETTTSKKELEKPVKDIEYMNKGEQASSLVFTNKNYTGRAYVPSGPLAKTILAATNANPMQSKTDYGGLSSLSEKDLKKQIKYLY
ncbi:MAG: hypothetical protein J6Y02_20585 [Pseudobutyrivibrio sp.]|nr:hypothetical protein [Pseudobutyrivibrio sp.]